MCLCESNKRLTPCRSRWRPQYTIRSVLLITLLLAFCCSWFAWLRKQYVDQLELANKIASRGGLVQTVPGSHPWLNYLLGKETNREVVAVVLTNECTDGTDGVHGRGPTDGVRLTLCTIRLAIRRA